MCWDWYRERELLREERWTSEDDEQRADAAREHETAETVGATERESELVRT